MVELPLARGKMPTTMCDQTQLSRGAGNGREEVVKLLLE